MSEIFQCKTNKNFHKEKEQIVNENIKRKKRIKLLAIICGITVTACILIGTIVGTLAPLDTITFRGMRFEKIQNEYILKNYNGNAKIINIPPKVRGLNVTSIGDYAFRNCTSLTNITIPNGVTNIGISAFGNCSSLTTVTIPDSVTAIGGSAFGNNSSLTTVTIPDSVTAIGSSAFRNCSNLTSVNIPDSVTHIGGYAFSDCSSLTSITIPNGVTHIGGYAFSNTSISLIHVKLAKKPTDWDSNWNKFSLDLTSSHYIAVQWKYNK